MSAAHTPGPWTYEQRNGERHISAGNGESLQCDARYYPRVSGNEADWCLIAAAPDLLSVAYQASFALRQLLPNDPDAQMTVRMLEAAIAKATGASS